MILERKLFKNGGICNQESVKLNKIDIDLDKLEKDLSIPKNILYSHKNWALNDKNEYYYYKVLNNYNDFIGEELAKKLKLPTAHYELGKIDDNFVVATKNFNINNVKYINAFELLNNDISYQTNIFKLKFLENIYGRNLVLEILKMTSLDIFMRQIDRIPSNYAFENCNNKIQLAPLYDYSFAFFDYENYKYLNYLLKLDFSYDIEGIKNIINKYPEFYNYLSLMNNINLRDLVNNITNKNNFNYNKILDEKYDRENENSHKLLKKII